MTCTDDAAAWIQALEAALWHASITVDEICQAQAADDSLQPVLELLNNQTKPSHSSLCQYPEDTRVLLSQLDSSLLQDDVLYHRFHWLDGTMNFLQIVLLASLCQSYIEWQHTDLDHFGQTKTCHSLLSCLLSKVAFFHWIPCLQLCSVHCAICTSGVVRHPTCI